MKWTTEKPKEPGWYWMRYCTRVWADRLIIYNGSLVNEDLVEYDWEDYEFSSTPIPFPTEE